MTNTSATPPPPPAPAGSIEFERHLGRDTLGSTWRGLDRSNGTRVDLREVPAWANLAELRSWVSQITAVDHRGILRTLSLVTEEASAYVAGEYCDGEPIFQRRLKRPRRHFEVSEVRPWLKALAEAVGHLHGAGLAHGAIHGGNVFAEGPQLKLGDLAVSRLLRPKPGEDRPLPLPLSSMSPQTLAGAAPAFADDVYGLAALAYDLLTGKPVFHSGDISEQIRKLAPPTVAVRRKELEIEGAAVPEEWEKWLASALAKDPAKRPPLSKLLELVGSPGSTHTSPGKTSAGPATHHSPATVKPASAARLNANHLIMAAAAVITIGFCATVYSQRILPRQEFQKALGGAFADVSKFDEENVTDHPSAIEKWDTFLREWQPRVDSEHPEAGVVLANARVQRQARLDQKAADEKTAVADAAARLDARLKKARADYEVMRLDSLSRAAEREKLLEAWKAFLAAHDVEFEGKPLADSFGKEISEAKKQCDDLTKAIADEKALIEAAIAKTDADLAKLRQMTSDTSMPASGKITQTESLLEQIANQPRIVLVDARMQEHQKAAEGLLAQLRAQAEKETPAEPLDLKSLFAASTCKDFSEPGSKRILQSAQAALKELKHYTGEPDGSTGKTTHDAIIAFQKEKNLVPNAALDDRTLAALGLSNLQDDSTPMPAVASKSSSSRSSSSRGKSKAPEKSLGSKAVDGVKNIGKSIGRLFGGDKK